MYEDAKVYGLKSEFIWMKVFAVITLAIAVLLIIYSIVILLKNLNVIKNKNIAFNIIGGSLSALLLIATIGLLVTSNIYANGVVDFIISGLTAQGLPANLIDMSGKAGLYQPFMLATSIILAVITAVFAIIKRKDS